MSPSSFDERGRTAPDRSTRARRLRGLAIAAGTFVALLFIAGFSSMFIWPPINDVETGSTPAYPKLQPRAYSFSVERTLAAAQEAIASLERFDVVSVDEDAARIEATAKTRSGLFTDDVTVRVEPNGESGSIVFIRSRSRVGKADFGQNARNIRALQSAMDSALGVPRPSP